MITCILLSAGESLRFGSPKALAIIDGKRAIEHLQANLLAASIDQVIVVLGAHMEKIKPYVLNHKAITIVYNKDYKLGQTSSFQAGISSVADNTQGIMLLPVDSPFIKASTIRDLSAAFLQTKPAILIPTYDGHRGHPPIFNASLKNVVLNLPVDKGINSLFEQFSPVNQDIKDPGIVKTFNTPAEFEKLLKD